jgi:hypothetical protein
MTGSDNLLTYPLDPSASMQRVHLRVVVIRFKVVEVSREHSRMFRDCELQLLGNMSLSEHATVGHTACRLSCVILRLKTKLPSCTVQL